MKTIYAKNSYDCYKNLCLAEDTIVRAFEDTKISFTREGNRFVSDDNELEVIILDGDSSEAKGKLVQAQGSLQFAIINFFNRLWKFKTKSYNKLLNVMVIDYNDDDEGGFVIEVGIDLYVDEDDWGNVYYCIDDIVMLDSVSDEIESMIVDKINDKFDNMDTDKFMELEETEIELER